ncbi:SNF2-related protein [Eisenbergiella porci]|uniref:SNF2-related protein n=1 Tax=Eisenbergiella porci TaxID=2652274 RepID=UPI002FE6E080
MRELQNQPEPEAPEKPFPRFSVTQTSDAFPDPEDAYAVWDDVLDNYYAASDGRILTFPNGEQAQIFRDRLEQETAKLIEGRPENPDLSGYPISHTGDTITIGNGAAAHEIDITVSDEVWEEIKEAIPDSQPAGRDPLAPAYQTGDTVYLDNKPFEITEIRDFEVQLLDPSLSYPLFRVESKAAFAHLLEQDTRNGAITEFLSSDPEQINLDLREALAGSGGLLNWRDKDIISGYFLEGMGNTKIAQYLSERYAGTDETMELETGETLDYFGSTVGFEVEVQDKYHSRISNSWAEIVPMLRGFYQQELDGFYHVPLPPKRVHLEGTPVYGVGDSVTLDLGNRIVSGTVGYVGEQEVRVDTGPYSWSHETFSREQFDEVLRLDERNAYLFMLLSPSVPVKNYRITDEHLGTGGSKAKFRANMDAIYLLKELETDQRQATPKEQEVLSRYVGWGGLSDAFDESRTAWTEEYRELAEVLTQAEYEAARASTLNAHYTSPTVIRAIYEAVEKMGFTSGNILEPSCGVGNFFGMLPESMAHSRLYGVELDSITGRIARQLYPKAEITIAGFETTDKRDFFDLAVGNVPFGQYKVNDPAYNKLGFNIHNYFFAKALDQVRPGGVVAFVTSRYTMDSKDSTVRKYLAQRAELLGAIRLPNNAFKANAGTEVVSDILFLQKRDRVIDIQPDWVHLGLTENGYAINSYFTDHPEMVLGRTTEESTAHGMDYMVVPIEALELSDQLHDAVKYIRGAYTEADPPELGENEAKDTSIPADPNVKNYSYTVVDGKVYYRENSRMVPSDLNTTAEGRVKGMVALRDCVRELIDLQMDAYTPDRAIVEKQSELNRIYDSFSAKYGLLNDRANRLAFSDDSSYYLLCSLEVLDDEGKLKRRADMFTKRTIKQHIAVTSVDTPSEALAVSIGEKARVDLPYMSKLCGKSEEEIISQLTGVIFKDPAFGNDPLSGWQTADQYLSGNVRQKLRAAKRAAVHDPAYAVNVSALEKAQPKDLDASEIEVRLGATWIAPDYYRQFMYEVLDTPRYLRGTIDVKYAAYTAEWQITSKNSIPYNNIAAYTTYGTDRANAYRILEDSLNLRDVRIYDTVEDTDGKEKRVLNAKETTLAAQKQQALRDAFKDWIWKDPERRQALVQQYNEEMNSTRPREYDGSHIVFSGMNPEIQLREHQKNAIAHVLYGGNTLLAHEVGAGKTFEMVAAAMESKRLGLCQKSIFVVPNHLTEQWASEFLRLYPSANILVTTKKDFETHNRKKFCARIATGDYDAVIIGHSQFERIPISRERQERLIQEQIQEITSGIEEVQSSGGERFTVKQLERTKKGLEARLEKLRADSRKDDVVTFEQLGCDRMFVDESDNYKNLFLYTKMRNVAGLSTTDAQKSSDMFAKCRYLDEVTGNRGTVFATGTPISNSMTEMYTIQRYLQYDRLKELNMLHFDCWASRFGETVTALELAPEGTGYRARTRFAKFFNLPELMAMFKEVADIKTADQLNLPTPEVEYRTYASKPTEIQQEMVKSLSERASKVHSGAIDPSVDNMLKITSDGRKLGLDQRIINPMLPDEESTKVNQCVDNVVQFWREGKENKLTQLVFCDISTPQAAPSAKVAKAVSGNLDNPELHGLETAILLDTPEPPFTIYADIRKKLVEKGIPAEQIAFIHEANTDVRKKELFARVRSGQVRVLLGSTAKMGAGTNVQDRLIALHDLDCPWRPRDLTQRKGRIERQGNTNEKVHVCRYVTEGTFDAYLWQTVENKQKFISQIMSSKSPVRSCDDVDETALSFAEIKALCAGDPRIKERMDLDVDVSRLKIMKADHQSKQFRMEDNLLKYFPEQIEANKGFIKGLQADTETLKAHPHPADGFAGMEVRGDILTDKENAGAALLDACKEVKDTEPVQIGTYRGFSISVSFNTFEKTYELTLRGQMTHRTALGADPRGNLLRIDNVLEKMPERLAGVQAQLDNLYQQQSAAQAEVGKPFPQEEELKIKTARLTELDSLLNMDGHRPQPEQAVAKNSRPSVLEGLKRPMPPRAAEKKTKSYEEVL